MSITREERERESITREERGGRERKRGKTERWTDKFEINVKLALTC